MESVAFFDNKLSSSRIVKNYSDFMLEGLKIRTGLIEEDDITLGSSDDFNNCVLVKKRAFSCNYRDKALILYVNQRIRESKKGTYFSHIGSDFVGEIIDVGENVKTLKIGDTVIPNISYPSYSEGYKAGIISNGASKRLEVFNKNKLIKVEDKIPDEILAAFPIAAFTAYSMIRKAVKPGTKVLVTAAKSNTSLAVINALKSYKTKTYVMTSSTNFHDRIKKMGVEDVITINPDSTKFNKNTMKKLTSIGSFDTIIDPFYDIYFSRVIGLLGMDSKYITCGLSNQSDANSNSSLLNVNHRSLIINLMINNISIIGNCIGMYEDGLKALDEYNLGRFNIEIDKIYSKGEESLFFERTYNDKNRFGKVIYKYQD